jgi:outer membrane receptor protein involved in Fe transport
MKKIVLVCVVVLSFIGAYAQEEERGKISGIIKDSAANAAVEYATISIFEPQGQKAITGSTSDVQGKFEVSGLRPGNYKVVIESVGYQPYEIKSVELTDKSIQVDLRTIRLKKDGVILQGVVVSSNRGPIENKIDKMVFNAEKDLTSQSGVATDLLKKVPQVSVDVDGNVQLAGNSSIRFLINGRPSSAFGSNIADVLQSIPASQIKSIEIVTNPGAKYDAQGLGGIINIILKQSKVKGINGSVSLTGSTRSENGSANLNARRGGFGAGVFFSGNVRLKTSTPSHSERTAIDPQENIISQLQQVSLGQFKRHGYQTGANFDWTVKKKNAFSGAISFNNFGNNSKGVTNQEQTQSDKSSGAIFSDIFSKTNNRSEYRVDNVDFNLGYKRTFSKEDRELEFSYSSSQDKNNLAVDNEQRYQPSDALFYGIRSTNPSKAKETEFDIDYTDPIREKIVLGIGGKFSMYDIRSFSDVNSYQPDQGVYLPNAALTNNLDYKQKVYAAYSELSFPVGKLFDTKLGGRYERTEINSFYSNAQQQVKTPGYNTFVPSMFFSKKLGDVQTIKLSYSKRIERPGYGDLNPFINTTDPKNISAGNPYLLPEIGQRIEFSYTREIKSGGSIMLTAFSRVNQQDIQPYIVYYPSLAVGDSVYTNVTVSTRQNIGSEKNAGLNIFADVHLSPKLTLRSNAAFFRRHTESAIDPGYKPNSFNYRLNLNAAYTFSKTLAGEFFGNFNSARNELQGRYPPFTTYSIALRKQVWNKKGSFAFTANNPFGKYVNQRTALYGPNFTMNGYRQIPFRSLGLNFTWKFGKLEFKKDKEEDGGRQVPDAG